MLKLRTKEVEKISKVLNFEKCYGLVPVVVQSIENKEVLMQAFMSKEAVVKTLTTGKMHYFSRSRNRIWKKGEESGNEQIVEKFYIDCDDDCILFQVRQIGNTCHTGSKTCFEQDEIFTLNDLYQVINERKSQKDKNSYTYKLLKNKKKIFEKIREESEELIEASEKKGKKDIVWEACDLLYHTLVLLAKENITFSEMNDELWRRHSNKRKKLKK
ncbi:bifunctional phosphoribosyl-AMP cyclohydrolase/phosphoribosyl-ATP diphosphatase HisIE [Candidatus Micrarchaeota archaeon]|nr:bifunctional phosphoribosyl-AMP cyclohydrolase/phosphoribosyl-ATP diphosphatase HisIE [Candidatus Micrarchaeota archaeon]